jgi:hypothetical protein
MRVAISGTHCCGKSTLIDEFLLVHPEYKHEREPYAVFEEDYGELLAAEPSAEDFHRQLEFMVELSETYRSSDRVIFKRSPVDFLAYMLALEDLGRSGSDARLIEVSLGVVRDAVELLDLIVFLPLEGRSEVGEDEDPELRSAVNARLLGIFSEGDFNLFGSERPALLEAFGSTTQRLATLQTALKRDTS